MTLTRDKIRSGWIRQMISSSGLDVHVLTDEELKSTRDRTLASHPAGEDLWLFGYGSLLWNPCFHYAEARVARVEGYHRSFCLLTHLGRGTIDRPGLVLGLDEGGSCEGVAFRLPAAEIEGELDIVWRREMVTAAYSPTWVSLETGEERLRAITFVMNREHDRYAGDLSEAEVIETIATAAGPLGSCTEYLFNTVAHLEELGIHDPFLHRLRAAVERRRAAPEEAASL